MKFGKVHAPWWDDRPVFVIGGGPSLAGYDLSDLRRRGWVLGINRAADIVPVDATFSVDYTLIREFHDRLRMWADRHEVYVAVSPDYNEPIIPGVTYLERREGKGLSDDPAAVINGLNSGYGGVNLAILKRAREIYLLGFDLTPLGAEDATHWHGGYPWQARRSEIYYQRWADRFSEMLLHIPAGVEIINANHRSAITAFGFTTYENIGLCKNSAAAL